MDVLFATSNEHKVREANRIAKDYGITFKQVNVIYPEIRAESVRAVAEEGAKYVQNHMSRPAIVEDSGLFIDCLGGFPGTYSAYVFKRLGNEGILKLMAGEPDRSARFISAIGYADAGSVKVFEGTIEGTISEDMAGEKGFGYDPIFIPQGHEKTFGEDQKAKNEVSHRKKAVVSLCEHLKKIKRQSL